MMQMRTDTQDILKTVGHQLDMDIYPFVKNGGFVTPNETTVYPSTLGEVNSNERQRTRRSKSKPRQGTTGGQGPSSQTSPLICTDIQAQYESELDAVYDAYPKTQVWHQPKGLLLRTESALFTANKQPALFLVAIPYAEKLVVKGWGFWAASIGIEWIGPRHTNFPDGSICAFESRDGTWMKGDPIIQLLDLYSVWAFRHRYMKTYGRWPGRQAVQFPYERIMELRADEYCGCKYSYRLYGECCQENDLMRNRITDAINFTRMCSGSFREPPTIVSEFLLGQISPPDLTFL